MRPFIPVRTSSKRRAETFPEEDEASLEERRNKINKTTKLSRKMLRPQQSFDAKYWTQRTEVTKSVSESLHLTYTISRLKYIREGNGGKQAWLETDEARSLNEQLEAATLDAKLCERQAKRLAEGSLKASTRRAFIKLFTAAKNGLGITIASGAGQRDPNDQTKFRNVLITVSKCEHPDPDVEALWCPVLGSWKSDAIAAHIFAYHHGQEMMVAIFGEEAKGELFSPRNGIIMSKPAEERFDKGLFVIVPDIKDSHLQTDINKQNLADTKQYKIRVLDHDNPLMKKFVATNCLKKWNELDGQRVQFISDHRPRARYLYFHYCVSILRRSWNQNKHWDLLKKELGQKVWATSGRYMSKSQLLAFVEELGHEVAPLLLKGATDPDNNVSEADETALLAANDQIRYPSKRHFMEAGEMMSSTTLVESDDESDSDDEA